MPFESFQQLEREVAQEHVCIPTIGGDVHVVPTSVIEKVVEGALDITHVDDWKLIIRSVMAEWLRTVRTGIGG